MCKSTIALRIISVLLMMRIKVVLEALVDSLSTYLTQLEPENILWDVRTVMLWNSKVMFVCLYVKPKILVCIKNLCYRAQGQNIT